MGMGMNQGEGSMSMASGVTGADDGWLEGFLAHGQMTEAAQGECLSQM